MNLTRKSYSISQVAWALNMSHSEVCRAIRRGVLPTVSRGGSVRVPEWAVVRLLGGGA